MNVTALKRSSVAVALTAAMMVAPDAQTPSCGRECLTRVVDAYLLGMARHDVSKVDVTAAVKFTENGEVKKLGEGFWKTAGSATYELYALDPEGSAAAVEAVVREDVQPTAFFLRIKVEGQAISEAETIVARRGQADPFAPQKLTAVPALYRQVVPAAERASRKQLLAAADAYFNAIAAEGTPSYRPPPLAEDANRFENGEQTTNVPVFGLPAAKITEQLEKGFFKGLSVSKRRYPVVDIDRGLVLGVGLMTIPQADNLLLAEIFKVTGGKIRQIQAVHVNRPIGAPTGWN